MMKYRVRTYILLGVLLGVVLLPVTVIAAPRYNVPGKGLSHWVGVSATGFEANPILRGDSSVSAHVGGGGQAVLLYELHKKGFFFQIGAGAEYTVTGSSLSHYDTTFNISDYKYRYMYNDYVEQQSQLRVVVPVRFGYRISKYVYAAVGASYRSMPIGVNRFVARTRMFIEGEFVGPMDPIIITYDDNQKVAEKYRFWPEDSYTNKYETNYMVRSATHEVAVELEVGVHIPLGSKTAMRLALYGGYDIPLVPYANRATTYLTDYSQLDENPVASSMEHLSNNLLFNSMLDTPTLKQDPHRLRAGLRLTFLLRVSPSANQCHCLDF